MHAMAYVWMFEHLWSISEWGFNFLWTEQSGQCRTSRHSSRGQGQWGWGCQQRQLEEKEYFTIGIFIDWKAVFWQVLSWFMILWLTSKEEVLTPKFPVVPCHSTAIGLGRVGDEHIVKQLLQKGCSTCIHTLQWLTWNLRQTKLAERKKNN